MPGQFSRSGITDHRPDIQIDPIVWIWDLPMQETTLESGTGPGNSRDSSGFELRRSGPTGSTNTNRGISSVSQSVLPIALKVLSAYCERNSPVGENHDAGPIILAALILDLDPTRRSLAEAALDRWLEELPEEFSGIGPFGGLGGFIAGLRAAMTVSTRVAPLYRAVCAKTGDWLNQIEWRRSDVAWRDYDFFMGPSGLILAGVASDCPREMFGPALSHLTEMCGSPGLEAFRAGQEIDPRSAFNIGRINTGLGHGLTGVASALHHAVRVFGTGAGCEPELRRIADWLAGEVITDSRGLRTWPPVGADSDPPPEGFNRRQAWCYGTPGVAWTLWDISQTLGEPALEALSLEAMRSFCDLFDADIYVDDGPPGEALGICHGVAGTLAVADAFFRHSGMEAAGYLGADLTRYLLDRSGDIHALQASDMSMLTGASGVMSVLLTSIGADRRWLSKIALR